MSTDLNLAIQPNDRLKEFNFEAHNFEVAELWKSFEAGRPFRTPCILGLNARYFIASELANPEGVDFHSYTENPDVMFDFQLRFMRWSKFNLLQDAELGLPSKWLLYVDFQNYSESAWYGCPIQYFDGQVPDTRPVFADCPEKVMEKGIPDPFGGIYAKGKDYFERFKERAGKEDFLGRPIEVACPFIGSDGVMTIACNLFGPEFVCTAMANEPERIQRLFAFINESTIQRIRAWRKYHGLPEKQENCMQADDSIALISSSMYRDQILPHHRKFYASIAEDRGRGIHLCGNATRHFKTLHEELGIMAFDTGFPVDFGWLRQQLGPQVRIYGGPHAELLRSAAPEQVREESRRILTSGVLEGGLFVLREGNNLAPGTPLENIEALYSSARECGIGG